MKLTIWQQFSSNHSASFTVVGQFASPKKAEEAATVLRDIIQRIGDYYRSEYPDDEDFEDWFMSEDRYQLSPVEEEIKQKYKLKRWDIPLDWTYSDTAEDTVALFRDFVIINNHSETWTGPVPFDQVVKKLGGKAFIGFEGAQEVYLNLRCMAADEDAAKVIEGALAKSELFPLSIDQKTHYIVIPGKGVLFEGKLERQGLELLFTGIEPYAASDSNAATIKLLSQLLPYLESKGCKDFVFSFEERN